MRETLKEQAFEAVIESYLLSNDSDYESGRRKLSSRMAKRFSKTLHVKKEHLKNESKQRAPAESQQVTVR